MSLYLPEKHVYGVLCLELPGQGHHKRCQWQLHHVTETPDKDPLPHSTILNIKKAQIEY